VTPLEYKAVKISFNPLQNFDRRNIMKQRFPHLLYSATLAIIILLVNTAAPFAQGRDRANEIKSDIVTLYARDPLAQSFCFGDNRYGKVFQDGAARNRCSDLDFGSYRADNFSVGVEGSRQGAIVDLGTPDDLQHRYGYEETVGKGQGFASLRVKDGKVYVLQDRRAGTLQELKETEQLFQTPHSTASLPVKLGHVYLLRLTDGREKDFELIVKLLVISYTPDESVTIRWQLL
jgi:hypothetical protein